METPDTPGVLQERGTFVFNKKIYTRGEIKFRTAFRQIWGEGGELRESTVVPMMMRCGCGQKNREIFQLMPPPCPGNLPWKRPHPGHTPGVNKVKINSTPFVISYDILLFFSGRGNSREHIVLLDSSFGKDWSKTIQSTNSCLCLSLGANKSPFIGGSLLKMMWDTDCLYQPTAV